MATHPDQSRKTNWTAIFTAIGIIVSVVVIGWYLGAKNYAWQADRALAKCIEEELTCRQNLYLETLRPVFQPHELTETEQEEMNQILDLPFEPEYDNPINEIIEVYEPEPECLDWEWYFDNEICIKWK